MSLPGRSSPDHPHHDRPVATAASRRERRSAELRERLFRAALALFASKGYAETTVEDITEAADVGKGTFFNYFPSKEHVLLAFAEMQLAKLEVVVRQAMGRLFQHGQQRGEIRADLRAEDIALVWRQTIFGTLLFWSLLGDASLTERIEQSLNMLLNGLVLPNA